MPSVTVDDQTLWARYTQGDIDAFSMLFLRHAGGLYKYGFLLCRDQMRVEDCIQDLFFQLWKKQGNQCEVKCVKTYLFAALSNRIQGSYRKTRNLNLQQAGSASTPSEASWEDLWIDQESSDQRNLFINKGVQTLPLRMRQAIYLRYFENLDYSEIAGIMNIRRQVAVNMVYRAINHLRAFSKEYAALLTLILGMHQT
ncbi:MAG: sigma-70 family RNA polymerase sigma factor [Saprospiraceae bacterium]|nr:sigma-70 family RNA polymerase sigma factor [Saprospiraceae bacterium]